jgi:hypothetical protein
MSYRSHLPARSDAIWMLVIGASGLCVRLIYTMQYTAHPLGRLLWVDEIVYWERAVAILRGRWMPDGPFFQDPLIHYILAGIMAIVGRDVGTLRVTLACVGSLTPVVTYWAGRRGLGQLEAILAGLAIAFYGPLVFTDAEIEKEGLAALIVLLALVVTVYAAAPGRSSIAAVLAGGLWGAASLLRANALLVAPLGFGWWLIFPPLPQSKRWAGAIKFVGGFVLSIAPVTLVNAVVSHPHEFILTTWQGGAMFYEGNGPGVSGISEPSFVRPDPHVAAADFAAEAERRAGRPLTPGEVSSFWMNEGLRRWRDAPLESLRFLGFKLGLLFHDLELPSSQSPDWVRLVAAPGLGFAFLSFGWLTPCAALGLMRGQRTPFWWLLAATTICGLVSTAVFFVVGRYRVPWAPGLALLAAAGIVDLARQIKARRWRAVTLRLLLVAAPVACLAWRPGVDPIPDRWGYFLLALVVANLQTGNLDAAIDVLDDARAADPRAPASATITDRGGIHDLWTTALSRAAEATPKRPAELIALARLARVLPQTQHLAVGFLDEAERSDPASPALWRERGGLWLGRQNEDWYARARAVEAYRRASADPSARITLALLTSDASLLEPESSSQPERIRVARAIIAAKSARSGTRSHSPALKARGTR